MPMPGWALPGVLTCGAAKILVKSAAVFPADGVVLAGSGLLLLITNQLPGAGSTLAALLETTPKASYAQALSRLPGALATPGYLLKGRQVMTALRRVRVPWFQGATELRALGTERVQSLSLTELPTPRNIGHTPP